jgi:hypothetical protein
MEMKNGNGPSDPKSKKPKFQFNFYWIYIVVAVVFLGFQFISLSDGPKEITWKKFSNETSPRCTELCLDPPRERVVCVEGVRGACVWAPSLLVRLYPPYCPKPLYNPLVSTV